ncbi:MAG TPA: ATP-binding protein [Acidimicrobiales bacterium]|nr:ATP-binding protein [Acidimicrobiales bacterium]
MSPAEVALAAAGGCLALAVVAARVRSSRRALRQRLSAVSARLGDDPGAAERARLDDALGRLERSADNAAEAVSEASSDAIRLRKSLDHIPQGVVICEEGGSVVFRNARAEALMDGRHSNALAAKVVEELLTSTWAGAEPAERTLELFGPPRRTLTVRTLTLDDGQRPLGVVAIIDDISERRRLESIRRDFVANLSHELKTPAGALGLLAETLMSEDDPALAKRLASRIQAEAFRISGIIDELLDLARIEAEEAPRRELLLTDDIVAEAMERSHQVAEQQAVEVVAEAVGPPVSVMGDRRQLVSALQNLLENAARYSDPGTCVRVRTEVFDDHVDLVVQDEGIGIPAQELDRIFERFYRVDQGRSRHTGGTGLGLAIVRHVAQNHSGEVLVESREGEGSTFTLRLPLREIRDQ